MSALGIGIGVGLGGGRRNPKSPLVALVQAYALTVLWDSAYYSVIPGETTAYEVPDHIGSHHWQQLVGGSLAATPVTTAGGKPALRFAGGQYYSADSLATLVAGDSVPWWIAFAIEGVTRDATARGLFSLGLAGSDNRQLLRANYSATASRSSRVDSGGTTNQSIATTSTSGILIYRYTGSALKFRWGTVTNSAAKAAGSAAFTYATIGATRYNAVLNEHLIGDVQFALGGFGVDLSDANEAALYTLLKAYAGY